MELSVLVDYNFPGNECVLS